MVTDAIEVRRAGSRFRTVTEGTDTRHSFSFGEHYDPGNVGFGPLLVHNDDRVRVRGGLCRPSAPDAEILTWVLSGRWCTRTPPGTAASSPPGWPSG